MIIQLNNKFYKLDAIKNAFNDFKKICDGEILDNSFEIELNSKESVENLKEEFSNYVLGLMKNNLIV